VLEDFPETHPDRAALLDLLQDYAEAVVNVQDPVSSVWWQVRDKPNWEGNYLESSASAMFTYALLKGVRLGLLDRNAYLPRAERAYHGLVREFIRPGDDGMISLTRVVSVGGLGGDNDRNGSFEYYLSEPVIADDPKGTGPFILASLEMERLGLLPQ
jgi:unsaturated rhamnogalacturonyl hydrolase